MTHPRLSIDALSSLTWSFDQDLALWRELSVPYAGLVLYKIEDDPKGKMARLLDAGIRPSTIVCGPFTLDSPETWDETRSSLDTMIDVVADAGGGTVYFPPGRTTGAVWREVLDIFADAVAPSAAHAQRRGVRLGFEPSLRTDVSFVNTLRDAIDVCKRTGLSAVADFGNCWMERDRAEVLAAATPHICLVQICDVRINKNWRSGVPETGRVNLGEGDLPLRLMMQECLATGYDGPFDLEVLGPAIEAEGYDSALRRGIALASALLTDVGA